MKIAVIDTDGLCYVAGHPNKILDENGAPKRTEDNKRFLYQDKTVEELKKAVDNVMISVLTACGATHYISYLKGNNTTTNRLEINPEYKQNRLKEPPWWWETVQQAFHQQWNSHYVDWMECDDAVNITRLQLPDSFIVSSDGDLLGLAGNHFNWKKQEWISITEDQAIYKFWRDMVVGQPVDNIKGLPGKGDKYWEKYYPFGMTALRQSVFTDYTLLLGEYQGIQEFYKNYMSLKTLEKQEGFIIPEPTPFIIKQKEEHSDLFT